MWGKENTHSLLEDVQSYPDIIESNVVVPEESENRSTLFLDMNPKDYTS